MRIKVDRVDEACVRDASVMLISQPVWVDGSEYLGIT